MRPLRKLTLCLFIYGCTQNVPTIEEVRLFSTIVESESGLNFNNHLEYTEAFNTYTYRNFYNGAGVALADINNDGLLDVYLCGNQVDNKLFLNKGNLTFEDITNKAGVGCPNVWSTGVSMADVNGDGLIDIYVCKSGLDIGDNRNNELFINNGNLTFTEMASQYGIADRGLSNHAAFFDYDKDGDLDMYLLNNSMRSIGVNDLIEGQRTLRDPQGGNKLYRNDGDVFTDVSEASGIYGSAIGFGLGVTVADLNKDGWQDIFVSNDFFERDYLYINQADGTFTESIESHLHEISMGSMGADIADINNDGYPEIYVTDMLPEDDARIKSKTQFENWDKYALNVKKGYHRQFTRNVLQLNHGPAPSHTTESGVAFSEISRFAGVHATDWSWGALIMDVNNDGYKDIFVANGIYKDVTDQDYINYYANNSAFIAQGKKDSLLLTRLIDAIPSNPIANYIFKNNGDLTFSNKSTEWGLDHKLFSNGAAYGDLDNDGDLDLVINNINADALLLKNNSDQLDGGNFLSLELKGIGKNPFALGTQVTLYADEEVFYQEQNPVKGYLSSVDHRLHFGLGILKKIDSIKVLWPGGKWTLLKDVPVNQRLTFDEAAAKEIEDPRTGIYENSVFTSWTDGSFKNIKHRENNFVDFDRDRLLMEMISTQGPHVAVGDVNNDGTEDVYLCGAKGYSGELFIQKNNRLIPVKNEDIELDNESEDTDALFIDVDGDNDLDLYIASGGNEFPSNSPHLSDRLYLNNGKGKFTESINALPAYTQSTSFVKSIDFDNDGDRDLLVGDRLRPFLYGVPVNARLLENNGKGVYKDVTRNIAPDMMGLGMLTDAVIGDFDQDGDEDVMIVGDWMSPKLFMNVSGSLQIQPIDVLDRISGLWNTIESGDFNNDGFPDLMLGNHGLNNRFQATKIQPMSMYINDFDQNGTAEQIICAYNGSKSYPLTQLADLTKQIPALKKKYNNYSQYENQTIEDIFTKEQLLNAIELKIQTLESIVLINDQRGNFILGQLPKEAQFAPIYAIKINDFDGDGNADAVIAGNMSQSKPELGIYKGSHGLFLKGDGHGKFVALNSRRSGIYSTCDVRDIKKIKIAGNNAILFANNNDNIEIFKY